MRIEGYEWDRACCFWSSNKRSLSTPVNRLENSNEDVPRVYLGSWYSDDWSIPQGRWFHVVQLISFLDPGYSLSIRSGFLPSLLNWFTSDSCRSVSREEPVRAKLSFRRLWSIRFLFFFFLLFFVRTVGVFVIFRENLIEQIWWQFFFLI